MFNQHHFDIATKASEESDNLDYLWLMRQSFRLQYLHSLNATLHGIGLFRMVPPMTIQPMTEAGWRRGTPIPTQGTRSS